MAPLIPGIILALLYFISSDGTPNGLLFIAILVFIIGLLVMFKRDEFNDRNS